MLDNQEQTTGTEFKEHELQQAESVIVENKQFETSSKSEEEKSSKTSEALKATKDLFKTLSEDSAFTTMLVGLVGYIVIAARNNMNNIGDELRYLIFLIVIVFAYKLIKYAQFPIVINFSKENLFFKISYILLLLLVIYQLRLQIFNFINYLPMIIKLTNGTTK